MARAILRSELMDKPPLWAKLWVWMILNANHKHTRNGLKRGQFLTSIADMREAMSYRIGYRKKTPTKDEIRSAYEAFAKAAMITTTKTTRGMTITILNYGKYQNPKNYEAHNEAHNEIPTKPTVTPHDKQEWEECKNNNPPMVPPWIDPQLWSDFKKHRTKLKAPMTDRAQELAFQKLENFRSQGIDPEEVIKQSIAEGWKGLFEPKNQNNGGQAKPKLTTKTAQNMAVLEDFIRRKESESGL